MFAQLPLVRCNRFSVSQRAQRETGHLLKSIRFKPNFVNQRRLISAKCWEPKRARYQVYGAPNLSKKVYSAPKDPPSFTWSDIPKIKGILAKLAALLGVEVDIVREFPWKPVLALCVIVLASDKLFDLVNKEKNGWLKMAYHVLAKPCLVYFVLTNCFKNNAIASANANGRLGVLLVLWLSLLRTLPKKEGLLKSSSARMMDYMVLNQGVSKLGPVLMMFSTLEAIGMSFSKWVIGSILAGILKEASAMFKEDIRAWVSVATVKPLLVGDMVTVTIEKDKFTGTIEEIGWFYSVLKNAHMNNMIIVPNSVFMKNVICKVEMDGIELDFILPLSSFSHYTIMAHEIKDSMSLVEEVEQETVKVVPKEYDKEKNQLVVSVTCKAKVVGFDDLTSTKEKVMLAVLGLLEKFNI